LVGLGGSAYYLGSGVTLLVTCVLLLSGSRFGPRLYGLFLLATLGWSLYEVGTEPWGLLARLGAPLVPGVWFLGPSLRRAATYAGRMPRRKAIGVTAALAAVTSLLAYFATPLLREDAQSNSSPGFVPGTSSAWSAFGGTERGTRYADLVQITPENVHRLRLVWTYRTGDLPEAADAQSAWTFEATPLKIGGTVYLCTAHSVVHAVDAETGQRRWMFDPHAKPGWAPLRACRGVAFYRARQPVAQCPERILAPVADGRLVALDAQTGKLCANFGHGGEIDLLEDLGRYPPGYAFPTSPPAVVDDKIVVGGYVMDGTGIGAPSGVIRAFDAVSGQLAWAWDMGQPERIGRPSHGEHYTSGTPNAWPPFSADEQLGLVYVPLGNATPDFYARHRSAVAERYGSSLVALDVKTGRARWHFQVDHHDLWDHDLPSQPSLVEFPTAAGRVPALIQPTKRGELFVLDRRTGEPLTQVTQKPVPRDAAPPDYTSPTQPFSVGMPSYSGADLTESRMWGMTPLDQLWCRVRFKELHYEGQFTPPSVRGTLVYPGSAGIFSWGGVAIDEERDILIANTVHSPFIVTLIPRKNADAMGLSTLPNTESASVNTRGTAERAAGARAGLPQVGTPYAATALPFLSPLGVPCINPPWGQLSAIDLKTQRVLWRNRLGPAWTTVHSDGA